MNKLVNGRWMRNFKRTGWHCPGWLTAKSQTLGENDNRDKATHVDEDVLLDACPSRVFCACGLSLRSCLFAAGLWNAGEMLAKMFGYFGQMNE